MCLEIFSFFLILHSNPNRHGSWLLAIRWGSGQYSLRLLHELHYTSISCPVPTRNHSKTIPGSELIVRVKYFAANEFLKLKNVEILIYVTLALICLAQRSFTSPLLAVPPCGPPKSHCLRMRFFFCRNGA